MSPSPTVPTGRCMLVEVFEKGFYNTSNDFKNNSSEDLGEASSPTRLGKKVLHLSTVFAKGLQRKLSNGTHLIGKTIQRKLSNGSEEREGRREEENNGTFLGTLLETSLKS